MEKKEWTAQTHRLMKDAREKDDSPETTGKILVTDLYQATHLQSIKLSELLRLRYVIPSRLDSLAHHVSARSQVCT